MQPPDIPSLAIVATPIGNLKDISFRAREVLKAVDYVLCEDTRRARKLKTHLEFDASLVSFHEHNERNRIPRIIALMKNGKRFALISDAGSPVLSDPGFLLVQSMKEASLPVTFIPGPSAVIAALVLSGLPPQPFTFLGFPPIQENRRKSFLESLSQLTNHTLVLFESPDRVLGLLRQLGENLGDRDCAVCRELTKLHEEVIRGKISELLAALSARKLQGEFTLVIGPGQAMESIGMTDGDIRERFHQLEKEGYSRKDALKKLIKESGRPRNDLYRLLMKDHES